MICDWLKSSTSILDNDSVVYSIEAIPERFKVIKLKANGWLVLDDAEDCLVRFAVLDFCYGDCDSGRVFGSMVFHGAGFADCLRECRHTWWGDESDGYVFYANGILIADAFEKLSEYFDGMIEQEKE